MNLRSYLPQILPLSILAVLLVSCYEEENWLEDNIIPSGEYYPTIYLNALPSELSAGAQGTIVLEFASQGTLDEIRLYQQIGEEEETLVSASPYQPAFSEVKAQDTLALSYTVPLVQDTVEITLRAEAANDNGLTDSSDDSFDAIPLP